MIRNTLGARRAARRAVPGERRHQTDARAVRVTLLTVRRAKTPLICRIRRGYAPCYARAAEESE